ncbi:MULTISPECIES: metal-dependent transcriptional regulator [Nesterenkonia]|uniref:Metal-dependent transcriptional regulator n=3 Tax=Actinomycetes TaxID=1760 RepID=A0ABP6LY80_9MICC|nr:MULTISPECIES: metal-dependent transcriptional regulator [unclassified Nesterenkonia]MDS2172326.1 metal-dependent transcriptional regulator [Nesterenkonia sp. CL21]OSM43591.1 dihydrofolate reductase [Nesterenkonia sp. PF2B19]
MTDLIDTTEMYLRTILDLEEEGIVPLRARIAERLEHSGPTVSQTVARLERDGLLVLAEDRHLELTEAGRELAVQVMRKHRLAERLLSDVIGLDWPYIHEEACRWEHVMSERVERRLVEILDDPVESPYGNPIPGLEKLGVAGRAASAQGLVTLRRAAEDRVADGEAPSSWRVQRLAESIQVEPEVLEQLLEAGLRPGAAVDVGEVDQAYVTLTVSHDDVDALEVEIPLEVAQHIFVVAR